MFRYTLAEMARSRGDRQAARRCARRHSRRALLLRCALALLVASSLPTPRTPRPRAPSTDLQAQARSVRREVARLDHRAEVLTEKYNVARAELDALNVRLQEARRDLERARAELDAAQALRGERLAAMYKSDGFSVLDVLFSLNDLGEAGTQLGYFRSIDEADQETVARIAAMELQIAAADAADGRGPGRRAGPRDGPARAAGRDRGRAGRARAAPRGPRRARQEAARAAGPPRRGRVRAPGQGRRRRPRHHLTARRRRSPSSRRR